MGLFDRWSTRAARATGHRLLRALLHEQQRQSRALERLADVLEQQILGRPKPQAIAPASTPDPGAGSEVSYVNPAEQARLLAIEDELRSILGRDPSEPELERAFMERLG